MANLGEFEFIEQLIRAQAATGQPFYRAPHALGIGDDAALIPPLAPDEQLAVSTDMLIEGRHYFSDVDPRSLGHKALAVNLSDLAAMGARPIAFTLAAGLRTIDAPWLTAFLDGMLTLARESQCALVGGDTTKTSDTAPQVFSVTVMGAVPLGGALRRDGLRVGDHLWVSGSLGDPAYAVQQQRPDQKLNWPSPRLALGRALLPIATAAIDISDGLQSELHHLLQRSSMRADAPTPLCARMQWPSVPIGPTLSAAIASGKLSADDAQLRAVTGGDEYELLFAAPPACAPAIFKISQSLDLPLTRIGEVRAADAVHVQWVDAANAPLSESLDARLRHGGFTHF
jgi:thiamine-monophosphate kinase